MSSRPVPPPEGDGRTHGPSPLLSWRYTQKPVGEEKTRNKAMGFAGGGAGRRDSGVRRVDDYRWTYKAVGRIEKPGDDRAFVFHK